METLTLAQQLIAEIQAMPVPETETETERSLRLLGVGLNVELNRIAYPEQFSQAEYVEVVNFAGQHFGFEITWDEKQT